MEHTINIAHHKYWACLMLQDPEASTPHPTHLARRCSHLKGQSDLPALQAPRKQCQCYAPLLSALKSLSCNAAGNRYVACSNIAMCHSIISCRSCWPLGTQLLKGDHYLAGVVGDGDSQIARLRVRELRGLAVYGALLGLLAAVRKQFPAAPHLHCTTESANQESDMSCFSIARLSCGLFLSLGRGGGGAGFGSG